MRTRRFKCVVGLTWLSYVTFPVDSSCRAYCRRDFTIRQRGAAPWQSWPRIPRQPRSIFHSSEEIVLTTSGVVQRVNFRLKWKKKNSRIVALICTRHLFYCPPGLVVRMFHDSTASTAREKGKRKKGARAHVRPTRIELHEKIPVYTSSKINVDACLMYY